MAKKSKHKTDSWEKKGVVQKLDGGCLIYDAGRRAYVVEWSGAPGVNDVVVARSRTAARSAGLRLVRGVCPGARYREIRVRLATGATAEDALAAKEVA